MWKLSLQIIFSKNNDPTWMCRYLFHIKMFKIFVYMCVCIWNLFAYSLNLKHASQVLTVLIWEHLSIATFHHSLKKNLITFPEGSLFEKIEEIKIKDIRYKMQCILCKKSSTQYDGYMISNYKKMNNKKLIKKLFGISLLSIKIILWQKEIWIPNGIHIEGEL